MSNQIHTEYCPHPVRRETEDGNWNCTYCGAEDVGRPKVVS